MSLLLILRKYNEKLRRFLYEFRFLLKSISNSSDISNSVMLNDEAYNFKVKSVFKNKTDVIIIKKIFLELVNLFIKNIFNNNEKT